jgi:sRNA-binding protein
VDDYDAYDVVSSGLLPVWTNTRGKIVVTPHVDTTGLAVGNELEVKAAGVLQKVNANEAVGLVLEITAEDEVRVLLY